MARPTILPRWATSPPSGYPGAIEPLEAKKDAGWHNGERPTAGHFNWLVQNLAEWATYFDDLLQRPHVVPILNLMPAAAAASYTQNFNGVAYCRNRFIAVGETGEIQHSNGGKVWEHDAAAGGYTGDFGAVAYGGGIACIVGESGEIETSSVDEAITTGLSWTKRTQAGSYAGAFNSVAYGGGVFVAVGSGGEIQTSPDGVTWTKRTQAGAYSGAFVAVTYGNGIFVAVGTGGEIQTSPDGVTWTKRTQAGAYSDTFGSVAYGNGLFVVGGAAGEIQTSPDAITWTARGTVSSSYLATIAYHAGSFALFDTWEKPVQFSPDGITWAPCFLELDGKQMPLDCANDAYGGCVLVGTGGAIWNALRVNY